jgi:hypothetical protein
LKLQLCFFFSSFHVEENPSLSSDSKAMAKSTKKKEGNQAWAWLHVSFAPFELLLALREA